MKKILCPYCFHEFEDSEVHFRTENIDGELSEDLQEIIDDYEDIEDFNLHYSGANKSELLEKFTEYEFFKSKKDIEHYEKFWNKHGGKTTEHDSYLAGNQSSDPIWERPVIDPSNPEHQKYLQYQNDTDGFYIKDTDGFVNAVKLKNGSVLTRRVCPKCHNPLPQQYGKYKVKFVTVIGVRGSGKTVYLSQLLKGMYNYTAKVNLSSNTTGNTRYFVENNSVRVHKSLPAGTPVKLFQQPLFYQIIHKEGEQNVADTLVMYDVPGELFDRRADEDDILTYAEFIKHSDGLIILLDPNQFSINSDNRDEYEGHETSYILDKISTIINDNLTHSNDTPIAICISKFDKESVREMVGDDLYQCASVDVKSIIDSNGNIVSKFNAEQYNKISEKLNEFITSTEPALAVQCKTIYNNYLYFTTSAIGCDVGDYESEKNCPLGPRIQAKRIEEPLLWLFYEFGYIDASSEIKYPNNRRIIECPKCHKFRAKKVPIAEQETEKFTIKEGLFRRKKIERKKNYKCTECGYTFYFDDVDRKEN